MKKHIYNSGGDKLLKVIDDKPKCGIDFCDECGDCLHCYGGEQCPYSDDGYHFWVEYE